MCDFINLLELEGVLYMFYDKYNRYQMIKSWFQPPNYHQAINSVCKVLDKKDDVLVNMWLLKSSYDMSVCLNLFGMYVVNALATKARVYLLPICQQSRLRAGLDLNKMSHSAVTKCSLGLWSRNRPWLYLHHSITIMHLISPTNLLVRCSSTAGNEADTVVTFTQILAVKKLTLPTKKIFKKISEVFRLASISNKSWCSIGLWKGLANMRQSITLTHADPLSTGALTLHSGPRFHLVLGTHCHAASAVMWALCHVSVTVDPRLVPLKQMIVNPQ